MKLVILDTYASTGKELSYQRFEELAELAQYNKRQSCLYMRIDAAT